MSDEDKRPSEILIPAHGRVEIPWREAPYSRVYRATAERVRFGPEEIHASVTLKHRYSPSGIKRGHFFEAQIVIDDCTVYECSEVVSGISAQDAVDAAIGNMRGDLARARTTIRIVEPFLAGLDTRS